MASANQTSFVFYKSGVSISHTDSVATQDSSRVIPYHRCDIQLKTHRNLAGTITDTYILLTVRDFIGDGFEQYVIMSTDNTRQCNVEGWVIGGLLAGSANANALMANWVSYAINQVYNGN